MRKTWSVAGAAVAVLVAAIWLATSSLSSDPALKMPPGKEQIFKYYKMELLPDGFPGRRPKGHPDGRLYPHPLYGVYLIRASLHAWEKTGDSDFLEQAARAGDAAIERMTKRGDALIFNYPSSSPFNSRNEDFYSALTQAKYVHAFWYLHAETGKARFADAAEGALASLAIPLEKGGVMVAAGAGISFEEAPHDAPTYILNGWLSALENIHLYAEQSGSKRARELFDASIPRLAELLPLYDLPELRNSRYSLAGTIPFEIQLPDGAEITNATLSTPTGYDIPFHFGSAPKWGVAMSGRSGEIRGNLVYSVPEAAGQKNRLALDIEADDAGEMVFAAPTFTYDVLRGPSPSDEMKTQTVTFSGGTSEVTVVLDDDQFNLSAPPTNFGKKIGGKQFNSYHFMHINSLRELYAITGNEALRKYADKWEGYVEEWPAMPLYKDRDIVLKARDD